MVANFVVNFVANFVAYFVANLVAYFVVNVVANSVGLWVGLACKGPERQRVTLAEVGALAAKSRGLRSAKPGVLGRLRRPSSAGWGQAIPRTVIAAKAATQAKTTDCAGPLR